MSIEQDIAFKTAYVTNLCTELPWKQHKVRMTEGSGIEYDPEATPEPVDRSIMFGGTNWPLPYGVETQIPWGAALIRFGDPDFVNTTKQRFRTEALQKIKANQGVNSFNENDMRVIRDNPEGLWNIEVRETPGGPVVPFVITDPTGSTIDFSTRAISENADMATKMAVMEATMLRMAQKMEMLEGLEAVQIDIPADPAPPKAGRAAPRSRPASTEAAKTSEAALVQAALADA